MGQKRIEGQHSRSECSSHEGHAFQLLGERSEFIFSLLSGLFLLTGFLISYFFDFPFLASLALYLCSYFFGGFYTTLEAYHAIIKGRFEIDFLMLFAAIGAGFLGEWAEGALLLFLFSLGHSLEHMAMNKARKSISALSELAPPTAIRIEKDGETEVGIEALNIGDIILIKPNARIAADGIVLEGQSFVNQAAITGESIPVEKTPDKNGLDNFEKTLGIHRVYSGTINGSHPLKVKVMKNAKDSTLARIVTMVNEAEAQKSPTQLFTDKFERYFVPFVLILVGLLMFAFLVIDETFSESFYRAMAVLVSASPCALAISTPSAVLSGVARAARSGILFKGGRPLEDMGRVKVIAFDKTGTLTEGKPSLSAVVSFEGVEDKELMETAASVEHLSDHPLAEAIYQGILLRMEGHSLPVAKNFESLTARGVRAKVEGEEVFIGNRLLMTEVSGSPVPEKISTEMAKLESEGNTAMIVRKGSKYLGIIAVKDTARKEAARTIERLTQEGIEEMVMLSGDDTRVAKAVGNKLGMSQSLGNLLPEDKVKAIKELAQQYRCIAMIGDGVNDAPALATADVSIAMGAAGSAVALETADVALMADRLDKLPFAIQLSRKTSRIIKQNLWISLGMVAILIPLTISGIASIGPAVVAHEGSTLLVVLNALRLLGIKEKI